MVSFQLFATGERQLDLGEAGGDLSGELVAGPAENDQTGDESAKDVARSVAKPQNQYCRDKSGAGEQLNPDQTRGHRFQLRASRRREVPDVIPHPRIECPLDHELRAAERVGERDQAGERKRRDEVGPDVGREHAGASGDNRRKE